jgi:formate hydrogenlyase subunit 3/multisubunit Na+/H+ antiporter MnhD subunit
MRDSLQLLFPVLLPLLAAGLLACPSCRRIVVVSSPWLALPGLVLALGTSSNMSVELPWLMVGSRLQLDEIGRVFLLFTSALWLLSGQYALGYFAADPARHRFYVFFLLMMAGNLGVTVAGDMVTFYGFFALMSFASYGLVIHDRARESLLAGRIYMAFVVGGEVLLFVGIVGIAGVVGSTGFQEAHQAIRSAGSSQALFGLVLIGFAIKTAAVPLHAWLPLAYRAAPIPGSAVLSGPMIKAGLLGWLRFLPLGHASLEVLGTLSIVTGVISAFWGVAVGLTQRDPKAALGYSSVSQMGLIMTAVGAGLLAPDAWLSILPAIVLYAFHHAASKTALFLGTGVAATVGASASLVKTGLLVSAVALAGAPFTSGGVAKVALKGSLEAGLMPPAAFDGLLSAATIGTTLLMIRFLVLVGRGPLETTRPIPHASLIAWLALVVGSQVSIWLLPWTGFRSAAVGSLSPGYLWTAAWPVVVGMGVAWLASTRPRAASVLARVHVRPGDVLWLFTNAFAAARATAAVASTSRPRSAPNIAIRTRRGSRLVLRGIQDAERLVQQWPLVAIFVMFVVTMLASLLLR